MNYVDDFQEWRTSASLLGRLHRDPDDPVAWEEFVAQYGPRVYRWCRRWGLQHTDAEDVAQNVLLEIARQFRSFKYDPSRSFRGWLRTVSRRAWHRFAAGRSALQKGSGDSRIASALESVEAREDLQKQLEEQFDAELLETATTRVRLRIHAKTWKAFELVVYEQLCGAEAAERLGMSVASVYAAKSRVQKMLEAEIRRLDTGNCPDDIDAVWK